MDALFLAAAVAGGTMSIAMVVLSAFGIDKELHHDTAHANSAADGWQLLSLRSCAAGVAFWGLGGLIARQAGLPDAVAVIAGFAAGGASMVAVSAAMRAMLRLESDGTLRLDGAVGQSGVVYLGIPATPGAVGKVHLTLQGRTVEVRAVAADSKPLPTGARVIVLASLGQDTVEVAPEPSVGDLLDD